MDAMRSALKRSDRYDKKVRGMVLPGQGERYSPTAADRMRLEMVVKAEAIAPMQQFSYVAFLEELMKHNAGKRTEEACGILKKWLNRGLDITLLMRTASKLGVTDFSCLHTATFTDTTSDGLVRKTDDSYNTAWTADSGIVYNAQPGVCVGQQLEYGVYFVYRGFLYFPDGGVLDGATILSARLRMCSYEDNSDTEFDVVLQNGQPDYPHDPLQAGDYGKEHYSGNGGSITTSSWPYGTLVEIPLNGTALNWIVKGGTTKLCLRSSRDIQGTPPTGKEYVAFMSRNHRYGPYPQLLVTYIK